MPNAPIRDSLSFRWLVLWLATLALTIAVYWPGLSGSFLFDDHPHIVRNTLVQIDSLTPEDFRQAWSSSVFSFPNSRPLAMLTFGINHALSGLNPFAFKATNLALHLVVGLLVYAVASRLARLFFLVEGRDHEDATTRWWAWLTAALWLLHPLNLSPVLLTVQRMTVLSTLFVLLGMLVYLVGRQRLQDGAKGGLLWVWASPLFAVPGLLAKENAVLLPLLLLVMEWTLLRFRGLYPRSKRQLSLFFLIVTGLPFLAAIGYLLTHPAYLGFSGRPFDMTERVLTQTRVVWFYVQMLLAPDVSAMGLFHDDFVISRSLLDPWTTLLAVIVLGATTLAAIVLRKRLPLLSFAVLFFLAGHALESSVFPLELVYEHRNYLPAIAPLFALAYPVTAGATDLPISRFLLNSLIGAILLALAVPTLLRSLDWSSEVRFVFAEAEHHPQSARANFRLAQMLMSVSDPELAEKAEALARSHFARVNEVNKDYIDGLFGLVVLELHSGRLPSAELLKELGDKLRTIPISPINVSLDNFPFLVRMAQSKEPIAHLPPAELFALFDAALANPTLPTAGRLILYNSLRAYHLLVLHDPETALKYAERAVDADPTEWGPHDRMIRLLAAMRRWPEAEEALARAKSTDRSNRYPRAAMELAELIAASRRGEPVLVAPKGRDL